MTPNLILAAGGSAERFVNLDIHIWEWVALIAFIVVVAEILGFSCATLFPTFARDVLASDASGLGALTAARYVGSMAALLLLARTSLGGGRWVLWALPLVFSPDGQTLAAAWAPKADADVDDARDPEPRDLPQPRVSLIALDRSAARTLVAPHGYVGSVAFSPDGKTLAFGSTGAVHLFDLTK